jgi:hypothetical protein
MEPAIVLVLVPLAITVERVLEIPPAILADTGVAAMVVIMGATRAATIMVTTTTIMVDAQLITPIRT